MKYVSHAKTFLHLLWEQFFPVKPSTHAHWKSATRSVQVPLFSHGVEAQSSVSKKGEVIVVKRHAQTLYDFPTRLYHQAFPCIFKTKVITLMTTSFPLRPRYSGRFNLVSALRLFEQFSSARVATQYHLYLYKRCRTHG